MAKTKSKAPLARRGDNKPALLAVLLFAAAGGLYLIYKTFAATNSPIVFTNGTADCAIPTIQTISGDGTGLKSTGLKGYYPSWSADRSRIAYNDDSGNAFTAKADGSEKKALGSGWEPVWSKSGAKIALVRYTQVNNVWLQNIWVMNWDGSGAVNVTNNPANTSTYGPSWNGASQLTYYYYTYNGNAYTTGIAKVGANGSGKTNLTSGQDWAPDWSPDGSAIAFTRWDASGTAIYSIPAAGGAATKLTATVAGVSYPAPSVNAAGSNYRTTQYGFRPAWSPDSQSILYPSSTYVSKSPIDGGGKGGSDCTWFPTKTVGTAEGTDYVWAGATGLSIVSKDGKLNRPVVVSQPGDTIIPYQWSPGGDKIAFGCLCGGQMGVFTIDTLGTGQKRLNTLQAGPDLDW